MQAAAGTIPRGYAGKGTQTRAYVHSKLKEICGPANKEKHPAPSSNIAAFIPTPSTLPVASSLPQEDIKS